MLRDAALATLRARGRLPQSLKREPSTWRELVAHNLHCPQKQPPPTPCHPIAVPKGHDVKNMCYMSCAKRELQHATINADVGVAQVSQL